MYSDLREWMDLAEDHESLERITAEVHWDEEMAAVSYAVNKQLGAPALLFDNITGYEEGFRSLWNLFGSSTARLALTMNESPDLDMKELISIGRSKFGTRIEPTYVDDGPIYENSDYGEDVDLYKFPAPRTWPRDGGRYIGTACAVISRNPDTGAINVGTYRGMIQSENAGSLNAVKGKDMRNHLQQQWDRGEPLDVAVAYGILPELLLVSGSKYGEADNEFEYAGGIRGSPIELVEGEITGLPIPANAEIVAEGQFLPGDLRSEGPFGEFTGYYGEEVEESPTATFEAVHYRDDPILTVAVEADYPGGDNGVKSVCMRGARIWNSLESDLGVQGIEGVYNPPQLAGGGGMTVVSIDKQYSGHAAQVASVVSGAPVSAYFQKIVVIVDDDIEPTDLNQVLWAIATRFHPAEDVQVIEDTWGYSLDPSLPPDMRDFGAKLWIDATKNLKHYDEDDFPERLELRRETYERITERWDEFNIDAELPDLPTFYEVPLEEDGVAFSTSEDV